MLGAQARGPPRNFGILTGAGEIDGKIWVFASAHKAVAGLRRRLAAFVSRLHITSKQPIALMTDGAESLLRLKAFMPVPTRFVLDYFHVSMKLRHIDQCILSYRPTAPSSNSMIGSTIGEGTCGLGDGPSLKNPSIGCSSYLIEPSAVEGTVNRLIGRRLGKGQHMCWTKRGAHFLWRMNASIAGARRP
jgi:hypothetical protein